MMHPGSDRVQRSLSRSRSILIAATLRELEKHGMLTRTVFPEVPPRTEYALTKRGAKAIPVIETLRQFGLEMMKDNGIKSEFYFPKQARKAKPTRG